MDATTFFKFKRHDEKGYFSALQMQLFAEEYLQQHLRDTLLGQYRQHLDFSKISNVEVDGVDTKDYPDFCDAFIASCDYNGEPANDEMLEVINEDGDFVYEQVMKHLH